jgi:2-polyprenyl-6-methoxyphenol hydroxylase-like FAD-dependent oxidoreductase
MYPENWVKTSGVNFNNAEAVRSYLTGHFKNWNPVFFTLFEACENFVLRPLNYFPMDQRWPARADVTLIGDAAHLMPPNGEGVNLAMLDALDLSECLTNQQFGSLHEAIAAYENIMFKRSADLCRVTVEGIADFASPTDESVQELIKMLTEKNEPGNGLSKMDDRL